MATADKQPNPARDTRFRQHAPIERPGLASPLAIDVLRRWVLPGVRFAFRASLSGAELLPAERPYLLVANHPSSLGAAEFAAFMALYAERFRETRPLAGFAHAVSFRWWPISWVFSQIGAIPSSYEAANATLQAGVPIALFPGSDHDGFRPFWQQGTADFGGRLGFLKIARSGWVSVVPMAFSGITAPLLWRSRLLPYLFVWPRLVGVKRYGLSVLAVLGAALVMLLLPLAIHWRFLIALAWAASPLAMLSWLPATIRIRIGEPITPEALFGEKGSADDARLPEALATIERAVQGLLDAR